MLSEGWWELHCKEPMHEKAGQPWCGPFVTRARQCPDALGWGPLFTAVTAFGLLLTDSPTISHLLQGKPCQTERQRFTSAGLPVRPPYASMDAHHALAPACVNGRKVIKLSPIQQRVLKIMTSIWDIVFQLIYKNIPRGEEEVSPCLALCLRNSTCASSLRCEGTSWLRGPGWFSAMGPQCKHDPGLHLLSSQVLW